MKWQDKEVSKLFDSELMSAYISLAELDNYRYTQISTNQDKYDKKFRNQPTPQINQNFIDLQLELNNELKKRKLI